MSTIEPRIVHRRKRVRRPAVLWAARTNSIPAILGIVRLQCVQINEQ